MESGIIPLREDTVENKGGLKSFRVGMRGSMNGFRTAALGGKSDAMRQWTSRLGQGGVRAGTKLVVRVLSCLARRWRMNLRRIFACKPQAHAI